MSALFDLQYLDIKLIQFICITDKIFHFYNIAFLFDEPSQEKRNQLFQKASQEHKILLSMPLTADNN